jgi:hypothetical protein
MHFLRRIVESWSRNNKSVAWVHERTISIARPPLVGEVSANILRVEGVAWSAQRIPTAVFSIFQTAAATSSSKQLQIQRSRVQFSALPHSLSNGSEMGSTQPLERREYGRRDSSLWPRGTLYPRKLALTSSTNGGRSVGTVRSLTQAMGFLQVYNVEWCDQSRLSS